jgi:imidazole glycerol phosphate synthase subunit HisF
MLKTRIIPCLDVADGRVVKGVSLVVIGEPQRGFNNVG